MGRSLNRRSLIVINLLKKIIFQTYLCCGKKQLQSGLQ